MVINVISFNRYSIPIHTSTIMVIYRARFHMCSTTGINKTCVIYCRLAVYGSTCITLYNPGFPYCNSLTRYSRIAITRHTTTNNNAAITRNIRGFCTTDYTFYIHTKSGITSFHGNGIGIHATDSRYIQANLIGRIYALCI